MVGPYSLSLLHSLGMVGVVWVGWWVCIDNGALQHLHIQSLINKALMCVWCGRDFVVLSVIAIIAIVIPYRYDHPPTSPLLRYKHVYKYVYMYINICVCIYIPALAPLLLSYALCDCGWLQCVFRSRSGLV